MALSIYTNIYSMNAQRSLGISSGIQGKALERLSSGLRINHASDDASGLAISEQLRGQISGMKRASMNAQDGISYLQTAEGGMEEVTKMLQRMRELAVQAGNGIYTTTDRSMLQLEVDQLKDEINRITLSTEFNTKKLLDGSATGLWSSDTNFIGANIKGPSIPPGDYKIQATMVPGSNSVYKSNIMSVKDGVLVSEITTPDLANPTNVSKVSNPVNLPTTGSKDLKVTVGNGTVARNQANINANALNSIRDPLNNYKQKDSNWTVTSANISWNSTPKKSGYYEVEFLEDSSLTGMYTYRYRTIDTDTNPPVPSNWTTATVDRNATAFTAYLTLNIGSKVYTSGTTFSAGKTFPEGSVLAKGYTLSGGSTIPANSKLSIGNVLTAGVTLGAGTIIYKDMTIDGKHYKAGSVLTGIVTLADALVLTGDIKIGAAITVPGAVSWKLTGDVTVGTGGFAYPAGAILSGNVTENSTIKIQMARNGLVTSGDKFLGSFEKLNTVGGNWAISGGGTIQIGNSPVTDFSSIATLTKQDNDNNVKNYNPVTITLANIDPVTGVVKYGSLDLDFLEQPMSGAAGATPGSGVTLTGSFDVKIRDSGPATGDTKLTDIAKFTNGDGVNILENTQELKIYGNGKSTSVFLESKDTIDTLVEKITKALTGDLDMGAKFPVSAVNTVNDNLVKYVPNLHTVDGTNEAIPGTFIIQTAKLGSSSDLVFIGNQSLIDALGLATIQQGVNSAIDVKVTDALTGNLIGNGSTNDSTLRGVIGGLDVTFDQNYGADTAWNDGAKTLVYTQNNQQSQGYLHLVDNRTELQIGANQGQTMNISIGRLDTTGLGIDDVYITDMATSQRAITKLDNAIQKVNAARATIGAQVNRLDHTISNLSVASENLTASESRIRDLDIAAETTQYTLSQVRVQAATAMIAQANQMPQNALSLIKNL